MPPANRIDDSGQGTDAHRVSLLGLQGQRLERAVGITSLAQWFVVGLPGTNQELRRELFLVGQLLAELSTMEIQLVA